MCVRIGCCREVEEDVHEFGLGADPSNNTIVALKWPMVETGSSKEQKDSSNSIYEYYY